MNEEQAAAYAALSESVTRVIQCYYSRSADLDQALREMERRLAWLKSIAEKEKKKSD